MRKVLGILLMGLWIAINANGAQMNTENSTAGFKDVFPRGEILPSPYFNKRVWLQILADRDPQFNCPLANVTFEPGCLNWWHRHPGGQILLVTGGNGLYQEKGKTAQLLKTGDIVRIAPQVIHWHGATTNSWFSHLAIETNMNAGKAEWLEAVSDDDYQQAQSPTTEKNTLVRIAKITVKPADLAAYNAFLKEEIADSLRLEAGVLMLYAVAEKDNPQCITILEIYASDDDYQKHITTPHFLKYKQTTAKMIEKLELLDCVPLIPELKTIIEKE